jgi:hypothetical protein
LNVGDDVNASYVLVHNLNTRDILVSVMDVATNKVVYPLVEYTTVNAITLTFENIVSLDAYRAVIIG